MTTAPRRRRPLVLLAVVLSSGCSLVEHWMDGGTRDPHAAPAPTAPAEPEEAAPAAQPTAASATTREAIVASEGGCPLVFSEPDANKAFAVIGGLATDCVYDGVQVQAATMQVRWKPSAESETDYTAEIAPKGCGPGSQLGELHLAVPAETRERCPLSVSSLEVAMRANLLPAGSYR